MKANQKDGHPHNQPLAKGPRLSEEALSPMGKAVRCGPGQAGPSSPGPDPGSTLPSRVPNFPISTGSPPSPSPRLARKTCKPPASARPDPEQPTEPCRLPPQRSRSREQGQSGKPSQPRGARETCPTPRGRDPDEVWDREPEHKVASVNPYTVHDPRTGNGAGPTAPPDSQVL